MKVGILGSATVAQTLAEGFLKHRHSVMLGSRSPEKLSAWLEAPGAVAGTQAEAAAFGELLVLAVHGPAALDVLSLAGATNLAGKTVIDACNPISGPPEDGVLPFFTTMQQSLMEQLQQQYPDVHFVKAFNSVGAPSMVNPVYKEGRPTMFLCGNDSAAKQTVTSVLDQFGWDAADMGNAIAARAIEPLCMLWCIPGFLRNQWTHAFKLLERD